MENKLASRLERKKKIQLDTKAPEPVKEEPSALLRKIQSKAYFRDTAGVKNSRKPKLMELYEHFKDSELGFWTQVIDYAHEHLVTTTNTVIIKRKRGEALLDGVPKNLEGKTYLIKLEDGEF